MKKNYPFDEDNKYKRMDNKLRLEQEQSEFELYRTLQVHLGIFPEDETNKQDATIDSFALLNMSIRIYEEAGDMEYQRSESEIVVSHRGIETERNRCAE